MNATDLYAELEKDPEYRARIKARDEELERVAAERHRAERPIVEDLRSAGYEIDSVWDLVNTSVPYPEALPILMYHLEKGGYPDRVMESMCRALAVRPAVMYWDRLMSLLRDYRGDHTLENGLSITLSASATPQQLDDVVALLEDQSLGTTRVYFIRTVLRIGGVRGRLLVESLSDDAVLGKEATYRVSRRKPIPEMLKRRDKA